MTPGRPAAPDFAAIAPRYDELRPSDPAWLAACHTLLREASVAGRRVLDVGCGTGKVVAELVTTAARVWGVDASEDMLAVARAKLPPTVGLKLARAEALPFRPGFFDVVTMAFVVHLVDRQQAFAEARRVLDAEGRLAIWSADPDGIERVYLARLFPSYLQVERARFPSADGFGEELRAAGFHGIRVTRISHPVEARKEEVLERLRGGYVSTLQLLDPGEYEAGVERAARELPDPVRYERPGLIVVAE